MSPQPESTVELAKRKLVVAGITLTVYYSPKSRQSTKPETPVVVMFLLHGRQGSARKMEEYVPGIFEEVDRQRDRHTEGQAHADARDLYVVAFDQRNHGERSVDKRANMGWSDDPEKDNPRHAIDMYAIYTGTAQDVSYLIDFLPSYLFPNGERTIAQFVCVGKSMGGHSTWLVLRNEPRIKVAVPIIACPDYQALMSKRAKRHNLPFGPPHLPDSLLHLIKRTDPASAPYSAADEANPFLGKKILVLVGQEDKTVPWSASKEFVENLNVGKHGVKEVIIEPGVGHDFSPAMVKEVGRFVWEHALKI